MKSNLFSDDILYTSILWTLQHFLRNPLRTENDLNGFYENIIQ